MKKQLFMLGSSIASIWHVITAVGQLLEMPATSVLTEQNSKTGGFFIPTNKKLAHKDSNFKAEVKEVSLMSTGGWMEEGSSQGGEFLDDALRIKDQPLRAVQKIFE